MYNLLTDLVDNISKQAFTHLFCTFQELLCITNNSVV